MPQIILTDSNGEELLVNFTRVHAIRDIQRDDGISIITMTDGTEYQVTEKPSEIRKKLTPPMAAPIVVG